MIYFSTSINQTRDFKSGLNSYDYHKDHCARGNDSQINGGIGYGQTVS